MGDAPNRSPSRKKKAAKVKAPSRRKVDAVLRAPWHRRVLRKIVKWIAITAALILATPLVLTALYASPSVHPISTLMVGQWFSGVPVKRDWVPFDAIAPAVWQSVVSSEDGQFCAHDGVDWNEVNKVVDQALEGERTRGASTIPMQTVKNLYLWSSRSFVRKGLEVPLAMLIDRAWTKKRTMEIYLNIAEWGPGIFGIEAAAQHHFGRSAAKLTRRQAARLAATLPNPHTRDPAKPTRNLNRLARTVEARAKQSGAYVGCLK